MSLSTSSSRKRYAKIAFVITLGMGLAGGVVNWIADASGVTAANTMGRVSEARAALPRILSEEQELVMFFGSSMVRAGFSPRQFDRELNSQGKNIKSFNFGFGGLNPFFQDYFSRRIREVFHQEGRTLKLAIIEFNPFQATRVRWNRAAPVVDSFLVMLATDRELWQIARRDPARGALLFTIKYLRNAVSAEMLTSHFGGKLFPPDRSMLPAEPTALLEKRRGLDEKLDELFKQDYPDYRGERWHYGWQGGGTIPAERSAATVSIFHQYYATFQNDITMQNYRLGRILSADIQQLHFEPALIESFIGVVENFKQFSDKVEIVLLPRNTRWIHYSDAARDRLADAVQSIERATGLAVSDHQALADITPDMFRDATHLSRYHGGVVYTDYLIKRYGADL
ncbi:hypothetical protein FKG94_16340 [Exilibacterium tricleocarpae]|uniref:DUF1574 domain-containing protein n=1 Tax=Exilibacterium tricleocarpae TaxID=2591008 RepID=A0A545TAE5_9GAMM|nr:hypothetical protein [Exilibacterium tricleocarpae]TQV74175.1 hypothetical protein FKG94_16340 [Exilibacterium tricleocarpae]